VRVGDCIIGLISLLLGASIFCLTLNFPSLEGGHPGPALLPRILAVLFMAIGAVFIIRNMRTRGAKSKHQTLLTEKKRVLYAAVVIILVLFYIAFVEKLGYLITNFVLVTILSRLLEVRIFWCIVFSSLLTLGVYVLFHKILLVPLPQGLIHW